jgi:hypothetical protein
MTDKARLTWDWLVDLGIISWDIEEETEEEEEEEENDSGDD